MAAKNTRQKKRRPSDSVSGNDPLNQTTSNEYLHQIYEIYTYILSFISHDLLSSLGVVTGYYGLLRVELDELILKRGSKDALITIADLEEFFFSAEKMVTGVISMDTYIGKHLRAFRPTNYGNPFRSRPSKILEIVLENIHVAVSTEGDQGLEFTFPANVLAAIFSELITNVAQHSGTEHPEALIAYRHSNAFFECEIHDNGVGIVSGIESMVPYDIIHKLIHRKSNGLRLINRVITTARGLVLFGKSEKIGGTKVFLRLPVLNFHVDEL